MNQQWIIICLLACTHLSHQRQKSTRDSLTYRAGVLNYNPTYKENDAQLTLNINCAEYIKFIETAQTKDVDIIVFPEYGLTSDKVLRISDISGWATGIPHVTENYVPCDQRSEDVNDVLIRISCAAKRNGIYVVINIIEKAYSFITRKTMYYSSNIVFGRQGRIIAKYRKMYLSDEELELFNVSLWNQTKQFLTLNEQDDAIFNTDFGVTFATFTSYDVLFSEPALQLTRMKNITDIVHPTIWFSETPFLTATQIEAGWSFAENVNLLTSSYDRPTSSNTGGGIYLGRKGIGEVLLPNTLLITYNVPKIKRNESLKSSSFDYHYDDIYNSILKIELQNEDQQNKLCNRQEKIDVSEQNKVFLYREYIDHASFSLECKLFEEDICDNGFCCKFKGRVERLDPCTKYRFVVFKKHRTIFNIKGGVLICAIIQCSSNLIESCGSMEKSKTLFSNLEIIAEFKNYKDLLIIPSTLSSNSLPLNDWKYSEDIHGDNMSVIMSLDRRTSNIATFGLYVRNFNTDQVNI